VLHDPPYLYPSHLACFQPLNSVDRPEFRALLKFQRTATEEADIPHRTKITQRILDTAERVEQLVKERYQVWFVLFHSIAMDIVRSSFHTLQL
jgi:hypothetical protein